MMLILADLPVTLEYLRPWQAALLFLALAAPVAWLGVRSLAGLGPVRKWVAIGVRLMVLFLLVLVIGGVRWQRQNEDVEVIVLRDISVSTQNMVNFPGQSLTTAIDDYLRGVSDEKHKRGDDRIGVIGFSTGALIDAMPNTKLQLDQRAVRAAGPGTDIAAAIQLALATMHREAMHRLLLISDGNPTTGDLDAAVSAAAAQGVPIDVMPLDYDVKSEVLVERFTAPAWKREDEPFSIEVILRSTNALAVTGKLTVTHNDRPMDLDPTSPGVQAARVVTLQPGRNVQRVQVPALEGSNVIHQFRAVFEGENVSAQVRSGSEKTEKAHGSPSVGLGAGDTLLQNNAADAFTFVRGKGKVLYIDNVEGGRGEVLRGALANEGINLEQRTGGVDNFPRSLIELQNYDSVVLANVPRGAGGLDEEQQKMLASYVHDMGGGLVMIGGDQSFGAGGWGGSKHEEVLPVNMDIPAQRQMPKGALVLVMHSCEMPDGNYWGEQCALKAVETLSFRDEIGVISYAWGAGGAQWDFPLAEKGDGSRVNSAIKNMQLGDMPSFDESIDLALNGKNGRGGLKDSDARQKHIIVISDGDPAPPNANLVQQLKNAKISVSTVTVYPHDMSDQGLPPTMRRMAEELKGRAYGPINQNPNQLPQIFIKEATVVRRSLIFEDKKGIPVKLTPSASELVKGMSAFPDVFGFVLTSRKPNPQIEVPLVGGKNNDPLLAHWQTGLGKAATWMSDAHNKWAANWMGSAEYAKFWAQVVRSVSRPPMSADFDVQTVQVGDKGRITVEALNRDSAFLNFLSVSGQVVGPDSKARNVRLVQTGPGTYVGEFDASEPGTYVAILNGRGPKNEGGVMLTGMAVNSSPELRDLKSNNAVLRDVAERTRGRVLPPFDAVAANLFTREGLRQTASPLPVWDLLVPVLLALIIADVATRRIAWDWLATKRFAAATADKVRGFTVVRKVETRQSLDALRKVKVETAAVTKPEEEAGGVAKPQAPAPASRPDPKAKFEAAAKVEGDITQVVGGATDKPVPPPPKKIEPKGAPGGPGASLGGLMAAKKRAQEQIRQKEQGE
jgi:uncharacterized membrane protein